MKRTIAFGGSQRSNHLSFCVLCGLLLWCAAWTQEKPAGGIQWAKDLPSAMAQSAQDGRPVLTYFTFDT